MITDTQSYAWVIRNAFLDALSSDAFFAGYTARPNKMLVVKPEDLPYLGVYIVDEVMTPDGDANAGDIRFSHVLRIGFSVIVANNDQALAEQKIDAAFWRISNRLFCDPDLMNVIESNMSDNLRIEGIVRGTRRHVFGSPTFSNETPIAELQYEISCMFRTMWDPVITDELQEIDITLDVPPGTPPIHIPIVFESSAKGERTDGRSQHAHGATRHKHHRVKAESGT